MRHNSTNACMRRQSNGTTSSAAPDAGLVFTSPHTESMCPANTRSYRKPSSDSSHERCWGPLDLELAQYAISCLSSGGIRNMYNQASIIVNFLSNITIESCPPSPTGCKGFFHIVCADNAPLWILDEVAPPSILQLNNEADIDIGEPRTDCGACTYLGLFPPNFSDLYDADTHCYGK